MIAEDNFKVNQVSKYEPAYQTCNKKARTLERQEWIDYTHAQKKHAIRAKQPFLLLEKA